MASEQAVAAGSRIRLAAGRLGGVLLPVLACSLALSTSLISIAALLILLCWLIEGRFAEKCREIMANPVCLAVLAYMLLVVVGLLWTDDIANGVEVLRERWKILLLPVLLTMVAPRQRLWIATAFILGVSIAMIGTYLAWFDLIHYADVSPEHLTKGTFHVVYNPLLAFAIYLVLHAMIWGNLRPAIRSGLLLLAILMIFDMFITEGRTGQLAFLVLVGLLVLQVLAKRRGTALLLVVCILPALFWTSYRLSPVFRGRVDAAVQEIQQFEVDPVTSVGLRLLYWQNALSIVRSSPWFGVGTGDFVDAYAEVNKQRSPDVAPTDNPHNQYILVLCQFGLAGLAVFLTIFGTMFGEARRLPPDGWQRVRFALPVFFMTIMLTESYLVVYETGFLFSLMCAVLYRRPPGGIERTCCSV